MASETHRLEHWVHMSLLSGVMASALLLLIGLGLILVSDQPRPLGAPPPISTLFEDAAAGQGPAFLYLGLLVLLCTPILRVAVLAVGWALQGSFHFALVALIVLGLLSISVFFGLG